MSRCHYVVVLVCAGLFFPNAAAAQEPPAGPGRGIRAQLGASINNAGLQNLLEVAWTRPLSASSHPLLAGAHISGGIVHVLTPTQTKLGGWVEYSPLSILDIRAGVDPSAYFGTFNSLQGFDSYDDAFDSEAREGRAGAKRGVSIRSYIAPTIKVKAGPLAAATTLELEWWRSSAAAVFFYEPTRDTLLKSDGDRMLNATSVLLYQRRAGAGQLSVGALHTFSKVYDADQNRVQKLGAIAIREFRGPHFRLPHPKVTLVVARYLDDRWKDGQWTAALALGFRSGVK